MKINLKISKATLIFSLYIIISASFMRQALDFVRYDMIFPKQIKIEVLDNKLIPNFTKEKHVNELKSFYQKNESKGFYIFKEETTNEKKGRALSLLFRAGYINHAGIIIWMLFAIIGVLLIIFLIKSKIHFARILILFLIFCTGLFYAYTIDKNVVERFHVILFGILGFLFTKDNLKNNKYWTLLYSLIWCLIIASLDEIFQHYLPYRYGHVHDIVSGVLGGLWGTLIYITIKFDPSEKSLS